MRAGRDVVLPVVAVLLLGATVGVAWWWLAPTGPVELAQGYLVPTGEQPGGPPSDVFAAAQDATFTALVAAGGALSGLGVGGWSVRPERLAARWVAVVSAGLVAPVLAWAVGVVLGPASVAAQQAAAVDPLVSPLRLSTPAPLLVWSAATCTVAFGSALTSALRQPARPPARMGAD